MRSISRKCIQVSSDGIIYITCPKCMDKMEPANYRPKTWLCPTCNLEMMEVK